MTSFSLSSPAPMPDGAIQIPRRLTQIGRDLFLLELFHGPTCAFKDFAMQVLSRLMERALKRTGSRTTILGATSGDTGAAAVEAFRGRQDIELFILFPHGRISDVQRKQMTTAAEDNIHAIAVEGTFDDAQNIVKTLLGDKDFRTRHALSAINSINWARIVAQTVYYYTATEKLGPESKPNFTVPTGNFGDIFAGFAALKMGLPLGKLVIATNENDILARTLETGRYEPRDVMPTDSPSMDIQISSNFERLLFEASGRNAAFVTGAMENLRERGSFSIPAATIEPIRERFSAQRVSREEASAAMNRLIRGHRHHHRSAYRGWPCRGRARAVSQWRADGGAGHRASRKIPGRREAGNRARPGNPGRPSEVLGGTRTF